MRAIGGSVHYIVLLFTICVSLSGQQTVRDVYGWNATKWNMSLAQVKAAVSYPIETIPDPTPGMPAKDTFRTAESVEINGLPVRFTFHFSNDRLIRIELMVEEGPNRSTALRTVAFDSLKQSLIEKFGKFTDEDSKPEHSPIPNTVIPGSSDKIIGTRHTVLWSFPSTSIRLTWLELGTGGVVSVQYEQVDKTTPL